jgi:dihydropteroate synthase
MIKSSQKTLIMGILNVTPDSFSDGGAYGDDVSRAVERVKQMVQEGADIIDIGGESTRPGTEPVSAEEECRRVLPIIDALKGQITVPISIDTYKASVAEEALKRGATIVNDVSGLRDPDMAAVVAKYDASVVIMHMQGEPKTMQANPVYTDVITDIKTFFKERIAKAKTTGIENIILDPGIGFGKTLEHNLGILARLEELCELGYPILVGPSRKSFIGQLTDLPVNEREEGTIASVVVAAMHGAGIVRVHNVRGCRRALQVADAIKSTKRSEEGKR